MAIQGKSLVLKDIRQPEIHATGGSVWYAEAATCTSYRYITQTQLHSTKIREK